jgi:hypothetical protein
MSEPIVTEVPVQQVPEVPTKEQLESQLTQMVLQRSNLKDQIEQIEKQMAPVVAMVQLLGAQEAVAQAAVEEVIED